MPLVTTKTKIIIFSIYGNYVIDLEVTPLKSFESVWIGEYVCKIWSLRLLRFKCYGQARIKYFVQQTAQKIYTQSSVLGA